MKKGDFESVKEKADLKDYADEHLIPRAKGFYNCPACGSGTGKDKSAAFSVKGDRFTCFSCHKGGDIFDLAGIIHKTDDKREQFALVASWAGISVEGAGVRKESEKATARPVEPKKEDHEPSFSTNRKTEAKKVKEWAANLERHPEALSYLKQRGISLDQAKGWGIGYDPRRKRVIIPYRESDYYHIDRDITGNAPNKYEKPKSDEVGKEPLWVSPDALKGECIFIVEGPFDALAVEACGFGVMAICSASAWMKAVDTLVSRDYKGAVVVALDNDAPTNDPMKKKGFEYGSECLDFLKANGFAAEGPTMAEVLGIGYEAKVDAADAYAQDPENLKKRLEDSFERAIREAARIKQEEYAQIMGRLKIFDPSEVAASIYFMEGAEDPIPTGVKALDKALEGGLCGGSLYFIGADSSIGKTTLALQVADNIAESKRPVLFVTIEQRARELVSKSLSRIMRVNNGEERKDDVSSIDLIRPKMRNKWGFRNMELLQASEIYSQRIAPFLGIMETEEKPTVEEIRKAAVAMAAKHGEPPVIFIDYLQLLKAPSEYDDERRAVDKNITSLRQMAGKMKTPVFVISSLNRTSYNSALTMTSFKESGGIEYGADVLLGLQPEGCAKVIGNDELTDTAKNKAMKALYDQTRKERHRRLEIVVLKNRFGIAHGERRGFAVKYDARTNLIEG